jgi:hypothetical protein
MDSARYCRLHFQYSRHCFMNSIPVLIHLQKRPVACQCGSGARVARDLCLRCLLAIGLGGTGDTSGMLDDLLSNIDPQEAECAASQSSSAEEIEPANYRNNR